MNKPLSLQQQKEIQQWLQQAPCSLFKRVVEARRLQASENLCKAAISALDDPTEAPQVREHTWKVRLFSDVLLLLEEFRSGTEVDYTAVEHSEIKQ